MRDSVSFTKTFIKPFSGFKATISNVTAIEHSGVDILLSLYVLVVMVTFQRGCSLIANE